MLPLLSLLGFGGVGITGGSMAAFIQNLIGNVIAGSPFAILQSAGMVGGGAIAAIIAAVKVLL
ncbi:hypothetical protein F4821DRAFT_254467 [Hypoxylon rubiginosum]|uniref:Uncharacterized protein n=1 Tax=Hypoxylon rubiginosum TaxID=110542 RepID=A0ACC0DGK8_9PEZI|nr:hypothetical protein F4821DRAFT_254467 [Hypoxylon rubiginosum]